MIKFDFLPLFNVFDEMKVYIEAHKQELKEYADDLDVDYDSYKSAAENGQMMVLTLRHNDAIVGFSVFFLSANLRNKLFLEATNHGLFVEKQYRRAYGERIIAEGEKALDRVGVGKRKFLNNSLAFARLLKKHGYKAETVVWSK